MSEDVTTNNEAELATTKEKPIKARQKLHESKATYEALKQQHGLIKNSFAKDSPMCIWCDYIRSRSLSDKAKLFFDVVKNAAVSKQSNVLYASLVIATVVAGISNDAGDAGWCLVVIALILAALEKFKIILKDNVSARYETMNDQVQLMKKMLLRPELKDNTIC